VTCYPHRDTNNIWQIKPANVEAYQAYEPNFKKPTFIRDGDKVILEHVNSKSNLLTHDVASPLTSTNMEMTTFPVNDTTRVDETIWTVHVKDEGEWRSHSSYVRLVNKVHPVAIHASSVALPDWGFKQMEVNGNKKTKEDVNFWVVDEIFNFNGISFSLCHMI
jgi:dolichyl-phosphate-mannose-protein mannosyltransferase